MLFEVILLHLTGKPIPNDMCNVEYSVRIFNESRDVKKLHTKKVKGLITF